jgi:hypothetical protein
MQNHSTLCDYESWLRIAKEDLRAAKTLLVAELFSQGYLFLPTVCREGAQGLSCFQESTNKQNA